MFPQGFALNTTTAHTVTVVLTNIPVSNAREVIPSFTVTKKPIPWATGQETTNSLCPEKVPTPIKVDRLAFCLEGYHLPLRQQLLTGFSDGFHIHFQGKFQSSFHPKNLSSAFEHPEVIDDKLKKEISAGRIVGSFERPPFADYMISPIGVVPKKAAGQFRMIQHLSYPHGKSVNEGIPKEMCSVHYATVDDAVHLIKKLGKGCVMAKTDIRNAFRIIPVHPSDYNLLVFHWRDKWYVDRCLPMGCSTSCKLFEDFSTALQWIAQNKLAIRDIIHILDDFLIVSQSFSSCQESLKRFLSVCDDIGVPMAPEKTERPSHILSFAGIELDCIKLEARLPQDKIVKCLTAIQSALSRRKITLRDLQSLIGLLNFACSVVVPGRVFIRRLINLTIGISSPFHFIRLSEEVKKDLRLWQQFFVGFNGKSMFLGDAWTPSSILSFYTDAAKTLGFGIIFNNHWSYGEWPKEWKEKNIAVLELFPIVLGAVMWSEHLANKRVLFFSDNESVVHIINTQTSKDKELLGLIRHLVLVCLQRNIFFRARHVSGINNGPADYLSRLQVQKFKESLPGSDEVETKIPSHLLPENWVSL